MQNRGETKFLHHRYSVVGTVTRLRFGRYGFQIPAGKKECSVLYVQTDCVAHSASCASRYRGSFVGGKVADVAR